MVKEEINVVLTKPLSLDGESNDDFRAPNILQRVLSLFKSVRPGTDVTRFKLPAIFNLPKSHLQCFGELVYCIGNDMLSKCNSLESPLERFTAVVAWSISMNRPPVFGSAPYNPVLGETHHVSRGNLNILLEQVSHHPPVTALHGTDEKENIEIIWCQHPAPKFYVPGADWVGNVKIKCYETGLEAELFYKANPFIALRRNHRAVKGKIYNSSSSKILYEIDGHWDRTVSLKDVNNGKSTIIYNAKEVLTGLKAPIVKDLEEMWPSESAAVWSEVSQYIMRQDWEKASEAKKAVEEKQRKLLRERESAGETWVPKHFTVTCNKERGWDCSSIKKVVPPAPIVVPL
ncbi:oxysterol-binding protein-related protein 4B isoform X2 [Citrus clementina]|uniref:oxysterol-binding protein-related protein 4B isoform X2 n=1 Tax=Citrus clementina TaxID=85681 RepID=UPI000CECF0C3|nr:oxysterol-binding protein-related protein 4B isoform X2 [Citrus x clementina]